MQRWIDATARSVRLLPLLLGAALLAAALLGGAPAPAMAQQQHQIAAGETLDISVFRVPELTRQAVVDIDGQIAFPPLGQIAVAGRTTTEIATDIQKRLADLQVMLDAQVTVGLAAVRPVVIGGDVAHPGAIPYERGMTVRRAIALAGGLGILRPTAGAAAELRANQEEIAAELLGRRATLARARAELDDTARLTAGDIAGLAGSDQAAVLAMANSLLDAARAENDTQKAFLTRDLTLIGNRIERLGEQIEHQKAVVAQQTAEVDRYTDMQKRGLTPQTRVSEEYRTLNELRGNLAETEASITDVGRQQESVRHDLDRYDARRRATLEGEIQTVLTEIATLEARMKGVTTQLAQLGMGGKDTARVTLYRVTDGQETPMAATEGVVLQPGDLVEVDLPDIFSAPVADVAPAPGRSEQTAGRLQQRASQ